MSFLITPYFINETILKSDILKIEEILLEKFGEKVDKSETALINYKDYMNNENSKFSNNNKLNFLEAFNLINNDYFCENSIFVIDENKKQKNLEFEKISDNTFLKKYIIPVESSLLKKEEINIKSIFFYIKYF